MVFENAIETPHKGTNHSSFSRTKTHTHTVRQYVKKMGRAPCCDKANVKKGPWSPEEDAKLREYIEKSGTGGNWISLPQKAGLRRCGKSCRLRWLNYLRPNIKHGDFTDSEDNIICSLYANIGSRWSIIAAQLPGRTDNDIKNYWNTKLKKKLMGIKNINYPRFTPSESALTAHDQPSSLTSSYNQADQSNYYTNPGFDSYANVSSALFDSSYSTQVHQGIQDGLLRFGSEAASCSSSDGSSNTQISREAVQGSGYGAVDFPDYLYNGFDTKTIDYGLEEIKQLISTNLSSDFFLDEIKTEEKMAY